MREHGPSFPIRRATTTRLYKGMAGGEREANITASFGWCLKDSGACAGHVTLYTGLA